MVRTTLSQFSNPPGTEVGIGPLVGEKDVLEGRFF
jgi:hypothetical protein